MKKFETIKEIAVRIGFSIFFIGFIILLILPLLNDWCKAHPNGSLHDMFDTVFAIFVLLLKWALWISIIISSPLLALKIQEWLDYHHPDFNKKWKSILIGSLWLFIIPLLSYFAIFWNIKDRPLRVWNSSRPVQTDSVDYEQQF